MKVQIFATFFICSSLTSAVFAQVYNGVQSTQCSRGCAYCKHDDCLQCQYGFCLQQAIVNNKLVNVCTQSCGQGKYCNDGTCQNCGAGCAFCDKAGCAVCGTGLCLKETSAYGYSQPKCVLDCGKGSFCYNGRCTSCAYGCSKCSNKFQCNKCEHDYCLKEEDHNGVNVTSCVQDCGNKKFCNAHDSVCQNCPVGCKHCTSSYACHQCQYGYCKKTFYNNGYLNSVCTKECGSGYYCHYGVCNECTIPYCVKCKNAYECSQCAYGYSLDYHSGTCVSKSNNKVH